MSTWEFPKLNSPVIIAMKGLPCTAKSELGMQISKWAKCPLLYIDHFLDALSFERGYTAESPPSPEEAERLHRLAFDFLCNAASDNLRRGVYNGYDQSYNGGVVIKSRLSSTFELDRLVKLARESGCGMLLIVEFQMKNEYRFRLRLERKVESGGQNKWYKPRSWKDIEKAMEDAAHQPCFFNWDLHLRRLLDDGGGLPRVARLVFDPFDDLYLAPPVSLTSGSATIMKYVLRSLEVGQDSNKQGLLMFEGPYVAVHYTELRRSRAEKNIRAASAFSGGGCKYHLCGSIDGGACVLKYWGELPDDKGKAYYCGVCEERVISGHPAYSCITCFLLLHKSCAELPPDHHIQGHFEDIEFLRDYPNNDVVRRLACGSCKEGRKGFSPRCRACLSQTHLKCRVLPTVINHDCHNHFLNLVFGTAHHCKACGTERAFGAYYNCYICSMCYDIECVSQPRQVKHEHGGHKHVLKLTYSHDGMEKEEGYWCDICYEDMDPQNWFYSCQNCPYYAAHPQCARLSGSRRITASSSQSS